VCDILLHRRTDATRRLGCLLFEPPDVALEERERLHRRGGDDGGDATTRRQNGNLADDVARAKVTDLRALLQRLGGAGLDQEERVADIGLGTA
jgi:hypothetical protein